MFVEVEKKAKQILVNKEPFDSIASCEKVDTCECASEACHEAVFTETMTCNPMKRWIYCYAWKQKLGMVFDKDLGVYILPEWKEKLMERAK